MNQLLYLVDSPNCLIICPSYNLKKYTSLLPPKNIIHSMEGFLRENYPLGLYYHQKKFHTPFAWKKSTQQVKIRHLESRYTQTHIRVLFVVRRHWCLNAASYAKLCLIFQDRYLPKREIFFFGKTSMHPVQVSEK